MVWLQGASVHASARNDLYGQSFAAGDVIGCYISLNDLDPLRNEIRFFKNGVDQGVAFAGAIIASGVYFPAVSIYMKVCVIFNNYMFCLLAC